MTVTLELEPELEQGLQEQAQARGVTVEYFIHDLAASRFVLQFRLWQPKGP